MKSLLSTRSKSWQDGDVQNAVTQHGATTNPWWVFAQGAADTGGSRNQAQPLFTPGAVVNAATRQYRQIDRWIAHVPTAVNARGGNNLKLQVKDSYHNMIKQYHPDLYATAAPDIKRLVEDKSRGIIASYNYLLEYRQMKGTNRL
jgi:hypothetical protein